MGAWLPWAGVLGLLALLIAAVRPSALLATLHHAHLWLVVPVLACSLVALVLRALRWHLLLPAIAAPNTLGDSLLLFTAAQAAQRSWSPAACYSCRCCSAVSSARACGARRPRFWVDHRGGAGDETRGAWDASIGSGRRPGAG